MRSETVDGGSQDIPLDPWRPALRAVHDGFGEVRRTDPAGEPWARGSAARRVTSSVSLPYEASTLRDEAAAPCATSVGHLPGLGRVGGAKAEAGHLVLC
jgi:hypothetical protein